LQTAEFLRMATLGGAESLGLGHLIGSVETGKAADLIAVDLSNEHTAPVYDPRTSVVLSARAEDVRMTMVNGRILFEKGSFYSLDVLRLSREIHRIAQWLSSPPPTAHHHNPREAGKPGGANPQRWWFQWLQLFVPIAFLQTPHTLEPGHGYPGEKTNGQSWDRSGRAPGCCCFDWRQLSTAP